MKYPTQYEAELVLEMTEALQNLSTAGVPTENGIVQVLADAKHAVLQEFGKVFHSDDSPWKIERKRNKRVVAWDKEKGDALKERDLNEMVDTIRAE